MKKQLLFITAITTSILLSCSKEKVETNGQTQSMTSTEQKAAQQPSPDLWIGDPLTVSLDGWFKFDGNLKDQTAKLSDGASTTRGVLYTYDRKGVAKSAVKFNGTYGVKLFKVPQQTHASISVWVKYDNANLGTGRMIVKPKTTGLGLDKVQTEISGSVDLLPNYSMGLPTGYTDKSWHHFVVTFDNDKLRVYKDGVLVVFGAAAVTYPAVLQDYFIGYKNNEWFEGSVDDLRFYSRTLTASDVTALHNL